MDKIDRAVLRHARKALTETCLRVTQKDGELLPGKKGISLPPDQFRLLHEAHANLTQALEAQDESFAISLSAK